MTFEKSLRSENNSKAEFMSRIASTVEAEVAASTEIVAAIGITETAEATKGTVGGIKEVGIGMTTSLIEGTIENTEGLRSDLTI